MILTPGIYKMSFPDYQEIDAVNCTPLVRFNQLPILATIQKEDTPAMAFGRGFHSLLLERELFETRYQVMPKGMKRLGKKWEAFQEDFKGKEFISYDDSVTMLSMLDSLNSGRYETAKNLITNSSHEVTVVWQHKIHPILCKARLDCAWPELGIIADVKTSTTADPDQWLRTAINAKGCPHFQASWYLQGANATAEEGITYHTFLWILFETKEPYGISVVQATPPPEGEQDMAYLGYLQIEELLPKYIQAKETGIWEGYPDKIVQASLPNWYIRNLQI